MKGVCSPHNGRTVCFFFSSRRRHTRCSRDWSSDVCSSDLESRALAPKQGPSREPWNPLSTASSRRRKSRNGLATASMKFPAREMCAVAIGMRSEEHTSELQSRLHLVCRLLLEKKNKSQNRE